MHDQTIKQRTRRVLLETSSCLCLTLIPVQQSLFKGDIYLHFITIISWFVWELIDSAVPYQQGVFE